MAASSQINSPILVGERFRQQIQRYTELSLFAMVVTGFVALAGTGRLDELSVISVLCALGLRAFLFVTGRSVTLSVVVTSRLTIIYVMFFLADLFFISGNYIAPTVHMVLFILIVKLFSVQTERDYIYLAIISFLMILASAVLTVDSFFLASFCLFMFLTVTTSISMEIRQSLKAKETPVEDEASKALPVIVGSTVTGREWAQSLASTAALLVVTIALLAVGVFFVLPRVSSNYLSRFATQSSFAAGFSNDVTLGEIGKIQQLDAVVMHVEFSPGSRVPTNLKWRGISLNNFDGRHWKNISQGVTARSGPDNRLNLQSEPLRAFIDGSSSGAGTPLPIDLVRYRVAMQPIGANVIFVLPVPESIDAGPRDFAINSSGDISLLDPTRQARIYSALSETREPDALQKQNTATEYPRDIVRNYLQLPPDLNPKIGQLAEEQSRQSVSVYQKSSAIEHFLQSSFVYTLEMVAPPAHQDPLSFFLFTRKKGHCEYFSSAMAIMLRTQGIPSRIVNGFRNGEYNGVTGKYIVRAKDAHSWVEAYIPGFGWATFDPTPAAPLEEQTEWSRAMLYVDAARDFWNDWVVNYDFSHQESLSNSSISKSRHILGYLLNWWRSKYRLAVHSAHQLQEHIVHKPRELSWKVALVLVLGWAGFSLRKVVRWGKEFILARKPRAAPRAAASIWYERMARLLGRRGMKKTISQTPEEFVQSIAAGNLRDSVSLFTEHYERARFGDSQEDAVKLPGLYDEVAAAAKQKTP